MRQFSLSSQKKILLSVMVSFFALGVGPCDKEKLREGNFFGEGSINLPGRNLRRIPVRIEMEYFHGGKASVTVYNSTTAEVVLSELKIEKFHATRLKTPRSFDLIVPDFPTSNLGNRKFHLRKIEHWDDKCYVGDSVDLRYHAKICYGLNNNEFKFHITSSTGDSLIEFRAKYLDPKDAAHRVADQTPRFFTSAELAELASYRHPDIQLEHENLIQVNEAAHSAYLRLLPHINMANILLLGIPPWTINNVLRVSGNLVPFIFPDRWIGASQLKWQSKAEKIVVDLTKSQTILAIQSLAIQYGSQRDLFQKLSDLRSQAESALSDILELEKKGKLDPGSANSFKVTLDDLINDLIDGENQLQKLSSDIAQAIGANDPRVVRDIELTNEITPIEAIPILKKIQVIALQQELSDLAVNTSLEKKQMKFLQRAAEECEKDLWVHWMNPLSEDRYSLGFHLGAEMKIATSRERVFDIRIDQIERNWRGLVYGWVQNRNGLAIRYDSIKKELPERKERLEMLLFALRKAKDGQEPGLFSVVYLRTSFQDYNRGLKEFYSTRATAMIQQIYIDRIVFKGQHREFMKYFDTLDLHLHSDSGFYPESQKRTSLDRPYLVTSDFLFY